MKWKGKLSRFEQFWYPVALLSIVINLYFAFSSYGENFAWIPYAWFAFIISVLVGLIYFMSRLHEAMEEDTLYLENLVKEKQ